jgi:class III poly(R)-hydroxyalkanoic acid synthase PhaE subunit
MTPFEQHLQALADLWNQGGNAYLTAQQSMFTGMADTMAKASGVGDKATFQAFAPDTKAFEAAQQDFSKLWSSASELSAALTKNLQGADRENPHVANMLAKIFDPRGWFSATNEVDQTLQRMAEGPRLADLWNVERKFIAVFNAWVALRRHSLEHNKVMLEAWMRAAGAFAKMLNERANEGKALESWRAVLTLWVETANEVLLETQRSEAFLTTQRDLIKASSELRLAQQELAAFYSEMFGYPTRTELDDVHRTVTELRRELRAFKRESRAPRPAAESANGAARKAPRRAAAAQPRRRGAKPAQIGASS